MEIIGMGFILGTVLVSIAYVVFAVVAIISVLNSRRYTAGLKVLWVLAVLAFPFLGSLLWFLVGRNSSSY